VIDYEYEYNFGCNTNHIDQGGKIYPGSKIRVSGYHLNTNRYAKELVKVYLNGEVVFNPSGLYHEIAPSCIDFTLPATTKTGNNCIAVENENRLLSEEYCFELSQNICETKDWGCGSWNICNINGTQTRECNLISDCENSNAVKPNISQSCIPECREDKWKCGEWSSCSKNNQQTRICIKEYDCSLIDSTPIPSISQSCNYNPPPTPEPTPSCTVDTWNCGSWSACAPNSVQTRSCSKSYNCSTVETAPPATSQFCQSPNGPSTPSVDPNITNQNTIIKATVKLLCPVDDNRASQGTGTVIDSSGTIVTNKHVVDGTLGCWVGFIDSFNDEPYFGSRQIADIIRIAYNQDIALLKLRNPSNTDLTSINITNSNSNNLRLGDNLHIYGYPAQFGSKITFTSGDFSGVDGDYLKTTAVLEYGNSGGGAYTSGGQYIGIPSAVSKGELNSLGYILSVNTVNSWMDNSSLAYTPNNNAYSRVSLLENADLGSLNQFQLYMPSNESVQTPSANQPSTGSTNSLTKRLMGYILLQVEDHGEAYYVDPISANRYYLKDGPVAYEALRKFGLGITDADLAKIPVGIEPRFADTDTDGDGLPDKLEDGLKTDPNNPDTDGDGISDGIEILTNKTNPLGGGYLTQSSSLINRLRGRILLQVESRGEAWYLNPDDGKRYYMKDGEAAYQIMRFLSLGITNSDLSDIPVGIL